MTKMQSFEVVVNGAVRTNLTKAELTDKLTDLLDLTGWFWSTKVVVKEHWAERRKRKTLSKRVRA